MALKKAHRNWLFDGDPIILVFHSNHDAQCLFLCLLSSFSMKVSSTKIGSVLYIITYACMRLLTFPPPPWKFMSDECGIIFIDFIHKFDCHFCPKSLLASLQLLGAVHTAATVCMQCELYAMTERIPAPILAHFVLSLLECLKDSKCL